MVNHLSSLIHLNNNNNNNNDNNEETSLERDKQKPAWVYLTSAEVPDLDREEGSNSLASLYKTA